MAQNQSEKQLRDATEALEAYLARTDGSMNALKRARTVLLLNELRAKLPKAPTAPSITAAAIFIVCFAVAGILVLKRVAYVDLDATLNAASFAVRPANSNQFILQNFRATEVLAVGDTVLERFARTPESMTRIVRVRCDERCTVLLQGFGLDGVGRLGLDRGAGERELRLHLTGARLQARIVMVGRLLFEDSHGNIEQLELTEPEELDVFGGPSDLQLDLRLPATEVLALKGLAVSSIDFLRTIEEALTEG
jgi:hypothetical protein